MPMKVTKKKSLAIIGGGPGALMLAATLDETLFDVTVYEKNNAPGRKFLVAGDGGFNLTHSEEPEAFVSRYTPADLFQPLIASFGNKDLRDWLKSIGIETYVGTSKRVFPVKGIKPIDVLNAILAELKRKNVTIKTNHSWKGREEEALVFESNNSELHVKAGIVVFALGGASWKVTGSDGSWTTFFSEKGIEIIPFKASNCAYEIKWTDDLLKTAEGQSLKNIEISCGGRKKAGELVITKFGLEGGAIYALSPQIREQLAKSGTAQVFIDLKPHLEVQQIKDKFMARGNRSVKKLLEDRLSFTNVQVELLKAMLSKEEFTDLELLAEKIKKFQLTITAAAPVDEAISTVGGIALNEIDPDFQLKKIPGAYCIGEMLDWDAPTGGYLLQGCLSMGNYVGRKLNEKEQSDNS